MDLALKTNCGIINRHPTPACAEMGVVIHAKENVEYAVALADRSKKTAHYAKKSLERVMGSTY